MQKSSRNSSHSLEAIPTSLAPKALSPSRHAPNSISPIARFLAKPSSSSQGQIRFPKSATHFGISHQHPSPRSEMANSHQLSCPFSTPSAPGSRYPSKLAYFSENSINCRASSISARRIGSNRFSSFQPIRSSN